MNMSEGPEEKTAEPFFSEVKIKKDIRLGATGRRCLVNTTADRQRIVKETHFMFI